MIRVYKSTCTPQSLSSCKKYDGEDVKIQLIDDQKSKCYVCERKRDTDFEIEHIKSQSNYHDLRTCWNNLFLSCKYCNDKKSNKYDNILNPNLENIEELIVHIISEDYKTALFTPTKQSDNCDKTIELLQTVFNGNGAIKGLRNIKEERMFKCLLSCIHQFNLLIKSFLDNPNENTERDIRECLNIESEFLGFKYWIIRSNDVLNKTFAKDIIWNKK